jgi:hypothetical protein
VGSFEEKKQIYSIRLTLRIMNYQLHIEINNLVEKLGKLIGYNQAHAYYERVHDEALCTTRLSDEYVKEKIKVKIRNVSLTESV